MKNLVDLILILLIIAVLFVLNDQIGWVDFEWESLAIGGAAGAGPFQYFRNKIREKNLEKGDEEKKYKYRVLEHREFVARERSIGRGTINVQNDISCSEEEVAKEETFFNSKAVG